MDVADGDVDLPTPAPIVEQQLDIVEAAQNAPADTNDLSSHYADGKLRAMEVRWRDRFEGLKANGYVLRPRFRPGWQPSWLQTRTNRYRAEDFLEHQTKNVIDATRIKDNTVVMIKRIPRPRISSELQIGKFFTTLDSPQDPRNHCIPILDSFEIDGDEGLYIVMPLLRDFDDPPFYSVKEVIEFVHQTLEGTKFMHDHRVAHRDLSTYNIMMDGTPLYPNGFHPGHHDRSRSGTDFAKGRLRLHAPPVFYYLIDFGLSKKYEGDGPYEAWGIDGQDRDAPELQDRDSGPYDPFLLDIFTLGNVYKTSFLDEYRNLEILRPLVMRMMRRKPEDRPSISEAIALFEPIYAARHRPSLRRRLQSLEEGRLERYFRDVFASYRDMGHMSYYFVTYWYRLLTFQRPWKS